MKTILSWSSGKDSAWALHVLRQMPGIEVAGLLTTINEAFDRVSMHGVRRSLVEAQARAAGLPIHVVELPESCPNDVYEARMAAFIETARTAGVQAIAFGDLFLEDIRSYREAKLQGSGITPLFPLWGKNTEELAREMISGGVGARIVALDPRVMRRDLVGRRYDEDFLAALPPGVDPCGENGEFHTFVYSGPMFGRELRFSLGEIVESGGFVFADLDASVAQAVP